MKKTIFACFLTANCIAGLVSNVSGAEASTRSLPLTDVVLYSSGVGFFQRSGSIDGTSKIDLSFKVDDINDILKSMVVQDFGGGHVTTVTYGSRDPLAKTLKSFGVDLTENPSLGNLLTQIRGEKVEIMRPGQITGTVLGVEKKVREVNDKPVETEYLNLLNDEGVQSVPLSEVQKVKLLNERLNAEMRQALDVLAASHDTQKKSVGITFEGEGKRQVGIAYIAQTPVWKTSYRLVLDEKKGPYLQGWAIVENTSDEDWNNVDLTLVSGRPISFTMDLYQPLYTTRPDVQMDLYSSLRPQVYGDAMVAGKESFGRGIGLQGGTAPSAALDARGLSTANPTLARRYGLTPSQPESLSLSAAVALSESEGKKLGYFDAPSLLTAQGGQMGELFRYHIQNPVALARQKSAMLPIVSQTVAGDKLSIYNQSVDAKRPLNGFRLKNSTSLYLMQGPITVFDDNAYAGDARIEDLAPEQERLLSYALDLKTEVEPESRLGTNELVSVRIRRGTLVATRRATEEKSYNVRNRDQVKKTVLIEHPYRPDWKLITPNEPKERTRNAYRFQVDVEPGKTASVAVQEEKQFNEEIQLISANSNFGMYLKSKKLSSKVREALEHVVAMRNKLSQTVSERSQHEQRINEITQEQNRIRGNMERLSQTSELYTRYVKKLDQQETDLETLRNQIETLHQTENQQQQEINDYLSNLDV